MSDHSCEACGKPALADVQELNGPCYLCAPCLRQTRIALGLAARGLLRDLAITPGASVRLVERTTEDA